MLLNCDLRVRVHNASAYSLDHFVSVWIGDFDVACHVPGHVNHGNDGFHFLHFIPLKSLQSQLVLICYKCKDKSLAKKLFTVLCPGKEILVLHILLQLFM